MWTAQAASGSTAAAQQAATQVSLRRQGTAAASSGASTAGSSTWFAGRINTSAARPRPSAAKPRVDGRRIVLARISAQTARPLVKTASLDAWW